MKFNIDIRMFSFSVASCWISFVQELDGLLCVSLTFVDSNVSSSSSNYPFRPESKLSITKNSNQDNSLLRYAVLSWEIVCTRLFFSLWFGSNWYFDFYRKFINTMINLCSKWFDCKLEWIFNKYVLYVFSYTHIYLRNFFYFRGRMLNVHQLNLNYLWYWYLLLKHSHENLVIMVRYDVLQLLLCCSIYLE